MLNWLWEHVPPASALKEWQTAVSALVGFTGVIVTLLVNAWLARRADDRTRRHDRLALRMVFRSELAALMDQAIGLLEKATEQLEKKDNQTVLAVKSRLSTVIYDKFIDKIGILTNNEIGTILETYLFLQTVGDRLLMLGQKITLTQNPPDNWIEFQPDQTAARRIIKGNMEGLKEKAERAMRAIDDALGAD